MILRVQDRELRFPDFCIVGAAKSATTSLYTCLKKHPGIFLPDRKELYYFAFNGETPKYRLADGTPREKVGCTGDEYIKMYESSPEGSILGDTSSWYLYYHHDVIRNIQELYGSDARKVKIIMVLRNPVERAWSHYCMHHGQGLIDLSFREAINSAPGSFRSRIFEEIDGNRLYPGYDYIGFGMYSAQVESYLEAFDHVKVYLYEDYCKNPDGLIDDLLGFLGLESVGKLSDDQRSNISGAPKSKAAAFLSRLIYRPYLIKKVFRRLLPEELRYKIKTDVSRYLFRREELQQEDRRLLIDIFSQDIGKLQESIKRDLSSWVKTKFV